MVPGLLGKLNPGGGGAEKIQVHNFIKITRPFFVTFYNFYEPGGAGSPDAVAIFVYVAKHLIGLLIRQM